MARDFSTMKANVGKYVQDTSTNFSELIAVWINDVYRDVSKRATWSALTLMSYTFDTVAGTSEYDLPSDFDEEVCVANKTDGGVLKRYTEAGWTQERAPKYSGGTIIGGGLPENYVILRKTSKIMLDPTPADVKTIAMPYKVLITELSGDSDECVIHDIERVIEFGAVAEALYYKKNYQKGDYYSQRFESKLDERILKENNPVNQQFLTNFAGYQIDNGRSFTGDTPYA